MIKLSKFINREQLLNVALKVIANSSEANEDKDAISIVVWYIISSLKKKGIEPDDETIDKIYNEMVTNFILNQLVQKGYAEAHFNDAGEVVYKSTEKAMRVVENAQENTD